MVDGTTAGTPDPQGADAAEQTPTSGTEAKDDRDAGSDITKLNLEWKAKAERANQLEAENEALKARLHESPAHADQDEDADDDEVDWNEVNKWAQKKDAVAKGNLFLKRELDDLKRGVILKEQLRDIEDKDEQREVLKRFKANPRVDIRTHHEKLRLEKLESENRALKDREAKLRDELSKAAELADPTRARTHDRGVTASQHKAKMERDDFLAKRAQLENDPAAQIRLDREYRKQTMGR